MTRTIDGNMYLGKWPFWHVDASSPDDLLRIMDGQRIDHALLTSLRALFVDWRKGNDEVLAAVRDGKGRFSAVAVLGPFGSSPADDIPRYRDLGFKAIRLFPAFHNFSPSSAFFDDVCRAAESAGLPVTITLRPMMNWRFTPPPPGDVVRAAARHPRTRFVISGLNRNDEFDAAVALMKEHPGVSCETSALQGFQATARMAKAVGSGRLLFGSAAPLQYAACAVEKTAHAWLEDEDKEKIRCHNARALFSLA